MCLKTGRPEPGVGVTAAVGAPVAEAEGVSVEAGVAAEDGAEVPEPEGVSVEAGVVALGADVAEGDMVSAAVAVAVEPAQAPATTEIASATNAIDRLARKRILMARLWPTDGRLSSTCRMSLETVMRHKKSGRRVEPAATVLPVGVAGLTRPRPLRGRWARPAGRPERPARRGSGLGVASP